MSEPVSNARVEDVLASIRRLVSREDLRDHNEDASASSAVPRGGDEHVRGSSGAAGRSEAGGTLLLTPSQRVIGPGAVPEGGQAKARTVGLDAAAADRTSVLRLDETVRLRTDATEPGAGVDETLSAGAPTKSHDRAPDRDGSVSTPDMSASETEPVRRVPPARRRRDRRSSADTALEAKIAALEAVIARIDDNWEPDGAAGGAYAGRPSPAMDWNDPAMAVRQDPPFRLDPASRRDVPSPRDARVAGEVVPISDLVDEDMLRGIVSDIVREELQGALGERITRNVRKLVRREILRELARKDLD